jgi:hypothetical protein
VIVVLATITDASVASSGAYPRSSQALTALPAHRGGRRGHVERLAGEPGRGERAERHDLVHEGIAPAERVEQRDEHGGKHR